MNDAAEVVIVGGGTAGCVVAARLVESGRRVVVLESGPDYGASDGGRWPADLLDATTLPTSHDWGYEGAGSGGQGLVYDRARVIGGCSSHNGCTQSAGWSGDWDLLADQAQADWTATDMAPFFAEAVEKMSLREYRDEEIQPFQAAFLDACSSAGLARANDFTDLYGGAGAGCAPVNIVNDRRINTAIAYLDGVRDHPNLTVISGALVHRVDLRGGRATGVEFSVAGKSRRLDADAVVIAAGAYGSPEVLMRSGIGSPAALESVGIDVQHSLPGVGRNLHDHPAAELRFEGTAELALALSEFAESHWLPEEQAIAKVRSPHSEAPFDLHIYPWVEEDPSQPNGWQVIVPVAQLRPRSRGTVQLVSEDPNVRSAIDPAFFSDPEDADLNSVLYGVRWALTDLMTGSLATFVGPSIGGDPLALDDVQLGAWVRDTHAHYWHPVGSCRMGRPDDDFAVVDGQGRVFGVDGLRIVDASIFPDAPRATTALPTVAAAERMAAFMVDSV